MRIEMMLPASNKEKALFWYENETPFWGHKPRLLHQLVNMW